MINAIICMALCAEHPNDLISSEIIKLSDYAMLYVIDKELISREREQEVIAIFKRNENTIKELCKDIIDMAEMKNPWDKRPVGEILKTDATNPQ